MWSTTKIAEAAAGVSALLAVFSFLAGQQTDRDNAALVETREWQKTKVFRLIDDHPDIQFAALRAAFEADPRAVAGMKDHAIEEEALNRVLMELLREHLVVHTAAHSFRVVSAPEPATPTGP